MPLFQQSVVKKYLNDLDKETLQQRWTVFTAHFHNPSIQQNIINAKEEEYQEGFVRDLFVNVLGYTLNPQPNYNFVLEKKTESDSTKSDGAILQGDKVVGIIELKDTATTDLDKVEKQAFGYKHRHRECIYVITANFQKLRFYINDAIEYEEFDLFNLTEERFALLYICLSEQTIFKNIPLLIKKASLTQEEAVTKKLYDDYSGFRKKLFHNIIELNPQYPKIELFQKTQKLLDRFLFILFAEDRLLLPPNSVREILRQWQQLKEMDAEVPLYDRFKKYFGYLNTGHQGKQYEIFAYNGGLFATDEMLDHIKIADAILYDSCYALSNYDFQTEIDVNILGHIFEHSLNEIEELQAEAKGDAIDKSRTRRKKEGIFYTPRYITKYIVANTVGALCEQKKEELSINEEVFAYRKRKDKKREDLVKLLDDYRHWLLQLTICDPACGSGAFLNQALEYLIAEHRYIDELKANLFGDAFVLTDLDNEILEHNLYGVDINEEAVEIARLSLWLRTAKKDRKLSSLTSHIQCGNSLIADPAVAGDKAFNWQKAFPKVFEKGGFDVVIGNPPYLRVQGLKEHHAEQVKYFEEYFKSATMNYDLYVLFMEKSLSLIKENGKISFILPHKFLIADFGIGIRELFAQKRAVSKLIHFGSDLVFEEASTYTCIIELSNRINEALLYTQINPHKLQESISFNAIPFEKLSGDNWQLSNNEITKILDKLKTQPYTLENAFEKIFVGLQTSADKVYVLDNAKENNGIVVGYSNSLEENIEIERDFVKPFLKGQDISRYKNLENSAFVIFPYLIKQDKAESMSEKYIQEKFPKGYSYLKKCETQLRARESNKMNVDGKWFQYIYPKSLASFGQPKIISQEISLGCNLAYDKDGVFYHATTCYSFVRNKTFKSSYKYYLALLNSNLLWFFLKNTGTELRGGYFRFKTNYLKPFPIPAEPDAQIEGALANRADILLEKNKELNVINQQLLQLLQSNFPAVQVNKKLEQWPSLSFAEFLKELGKQKIKPSLPQQAEWMKYFKEQKTKALALQTIIDTTDKEIDAMVYALYGLTEEEIRIVEGNG